MAMRMLPRVEFNDRDSWGVYHGYLRSHSSSQHILTDGDNEETLGLLEYALGYPVARVRKWLRQAALRHLQRMQARDAGSARSLVSVDSLRFTYLACTLGEFGLARDIALRIEDPPDADYISTRSEVCTPKQQHLAYAVRAYFANDRAVAEAQLRQVRRGHKDDEETLQAAIVRSILDADGTGIVPALKELLRLSARRAKKNHDLSDQILCLPALGLAQVALEQRLITSDDLPRGDVRFPIEISSCAESSGNSAITQSTDVTSHEVSRFVAHGEGVTCLALGRDWLITAGRDHHIGVWDRTTCQQIGTLAGHTDLVCGIAPLWEHDKLVSVSWDSTVRAWDLRSGVEVTRENAHDDRFSWPAKLDCIARVPASKRFVMGFGEDCLAFWDLSQPGPLTQIRRPPGVVLGLDVSFSGGEALAATERSMLLHWDLESQTLLRRFEGSEGPLYATLFHPVSRFAFAAGADGIVRMRDLDNGRTIHRFEGHFGPVRCLACTTDGKVLFSGGDDGAIRVWDIATSKEAACLEGHTGTVRSICIQDGSALFSGGDDGTVRGWNISRLLAAG
jgi:WD40 repeat protein